MKIPHAWPRCPEAEALFARFIQEFIILNPFVDKFASRLQREAGIRIHNLVDYWMLPASNVLAAELRACGLVETTIDGESVWEHSQARFPRVRLHTHQTKLRLALAAENVDFFLDTHDLEPHVRYGDEYAGYESAVCVYPESELAIVTRRGYAGFHPHPLAGTDKETLFKLQNAFQNRPRDNERLALEYVNQLACESIPTLGAGRVTDEFFAAERAYYLKRNAAASWQYAQQQKLGIGWANHDHHTYRSSRESFRALMQLFLTMGFEMRERFYAGAEAGWGAQILEHPVSRVVIFADVDMSPDEIDIDFANEALPPRRELGTIGLWCALHGSSIAQAGMHHLEAEFDYAQVRQNLEAAGFGVMSPFTDLPILKQAFTQPEFWPVAPERLQFLLDAGSVTPEQATRFREQGAAGSHLEILQRWEGFKGFNKTGVSNIILATDARNTV